MGQIPFMDEDKTMLRFSWPPKTNPNVLVLKGFKSGTNFNHVKTKLQHKPSGGGKIENFDVEESKGQVVVTFKDVEGEKIY